MAGLEDIVMILELLEEETAGRRILFSASYKIAFPTDRRFSELYCEQMEADLRNPPHGFFSERTHLVLIKGISPEGDGFWEISGIFWTRFWQLHPAKIRLCRA